MRTESYQTEHGLIRESRVKIRDRNSGLTFDGFILMPPEESREFVNRMFWIASTDSNMRIGDEYRWAPTWGFLYSWAVRADTVCSAFDGGWLHLGDGMDVLYQGCFSCGKELDGPEREGLCEFCFDEWAKNLIISKRLYDVLTQPITVRVTDKSTGERHEACITMNLLFDLSSNLAVHIPRPKFGNFFDVRKGELSYSADVPVYNESGKWERNGRQLSKPSRLVRYLVQNKNETSVRFTIEGSDHRLCFNRYVEILSECIRTNKTMDIRISNNPKAVYKTQTSLESCGSLSGSCMRPESEYGCKEAAGFYNQVGAKIAYALDASGDLFARALVWEGCIIDEDDEAGTEFTFMDRIYGSERSIAEFQQFAHDNGWAHKVHQSFDDPTLIFPDGSKIERFRYMCDVDKEKAPFIDTLCFTDGRRLDSWDAPYKLQSTDGPADFYCVECGLPLMEEDVYWVDDEPCCQSCVVYSEHYMEYIRESDAVSVMLRNGNFVYMNEDDEDIIRIPKIGVVNYAPFRYYMVDEVAYCDYSDRYYWVDEVRSLDDLGIIVHVSLVDEAYRENGYVNVDGEWIKKEEEVES